MSLRSPLATLSPMALPPPPPLLSAPPSPLPPPPSSSSASLASSSPAMPPSSSSMVAPVSLSSVVSQGLGMSSSSSSYMDLATTNKDMDMNVQHVKKDEDDMVHGCHHMKPTGDISTIVTDAGVLQALSAFANKSDCETTCAMHVLSVSASDWMLLFHAAEAAGLSLETTLFAVGRLFTSGTYSVNEQDGQGQGQGGDMRRTESEMVWAIGWSYFAHWLVMAGGWVDRAVADAACIMARAWRVWKDAHGMFVLSGPGICEWDVCEKEGMVKCVEKAAGRVVESVVEQVVQEVVRRAGSKREEVLDELRERAESVVEIGRVAAKSVLMERVFACAFKY